MLLTAEFDGLPHRTLVEHTSRWRSSGGLPVLQQPQNVRELLTEELNSRVGFLEKRRAELAGYNFWSWAAVVKKVNYLTRRGKVQALFDGIATDILEKTELLYHSGMMGLHLPFRNAFNVDQVGGVPVHWNDTEIGGLGQYDPHNNRIRIKWSPPTRKKIIVSLATRGTVDDASGTLTHEKTHAEQGTDKRSMIWQYLTKREMFEVQAFKTAGKTYHDDPAELVRQILTPDPDGKQFYKGVSQTKLEYSIGAVDRLIALGLNPRQVALRTAGSGSWSVERGDYPKLEQLIRVRAHVVGLSRSNLSVLVTATHMERDLARLQARIIAQEALKRAA